MKTNLLSLLILCIGTLVYSSAAAQNCNCDHTLKASSSVLNHFKGSNYNYQPGDVFCLEAGSWNSILFEDFHGTEANPLIFMNCGGQVLIEPTQYAGLVFSGSDHFKLTGTGDTSITYGIKIDANFKIKISGMSLRDLTSDAEVEYCEIMRLDKGGSGFVAKTDPNCADTNTWRPNFVFKNLHVHHNYIHESGDEGVYIGYTGGYYSSKKNCSGQEVFGHTFKNVHIHDNIVEKTGRDGIQVSLVDDELSVHDNYVHTYGRNKEFDHNFGLIMGGGTTGRIYGNMCINTDDYNQDKNSRGMVMLSSVPPTYMYANVVINCGGPGIWAHNRYAMTDLTQGYYVINNTIIDPGQSGTMYNACVPGASPANCQEMLDNGFYNNLVINPAVDYSNSGFWKDVDEEYFDFNTKGQRDNAKISNNYKSDDKEATMFEDTAMNDYHLTEFSPARNVGMDVSSFGVTHDFDGIPYGFEDSTYDAGAYEWVKNPDSIPDTSSFIREYGNVTNPIFVFPNPSEGQLNVHVHLDNSKDIRLKVIDMKGAEIYSEHITEITPGDNQFRIDIRDTGFKGAALVVAFINGEVSTKMIMVK